MEYVDYEDAPIIYLHLVVVVIMRANVLELVHVTAHGAARNGLINGQLQPNSFVRLGRETSATNDLFLGHALNLDRVLHGARTRGIQWRHVEYINTLETTHQFETLQTSALALVRTHVL